MWYLKACRSCLTTKGHFEGITPLTKRLFNTITGLQLDEGDGFPQYFCAECYVHIKKAFQFRRKSRRAHFVLKEIHAVRNQVSQSDVEKVDRVKTNLTSPYSIWKPEEVAAFSYTTSDAVESEPAEERKPEEEITPEIQAAIDESKNERKINISFDANTKEYKIDVLLDNKEKTDITEDVKSQSEKVEELVKDKLKTVNSVSVLVDIKPANWKEIEKEEEERRKKERQAEIEAALKDIRDEDDDNFDCVDDGVVNNDFVPEEIDLEDVFKGLKEESEKESESEPEAIQEIPMPTPPVKKTCTKPKVKTQSYFLDKSPHFKKILTQAFSTCEIRLLTLKEQIKVYHNQLDADSFRQYPFKCAICVAVFKTIDELCQHVAYHNTKVNCSHICSICKDRFETEEELVIHGARRHWYTYHCSKCKQDHDSLYQLFDCFQSLHEPGIYTLKKHFRIRPQRHEDMYKPLTAWTGPKNSPFKCEQCKIYFKEDYRYESHIKKHTPGARGLKGKWCDICSIKAKTIQGLEIHMRQWHLYSYTCKQCKRKFRNITQAREHLEKGHVKMVCGVCKKDCKTLYKYQVHQSKHKADCNMCLHTATNPSKLLIHQLDEHGYIRLNTAAELNDLRYFCVECKLYFTEEKLLFKHQARMKHEAAKNYEQGCAACVLWFDSKEEAKKHSDSCTKGFPRKCPYDHCDFILEDVSSFVGHKLSAHKNQDYIGLPGDERLCDICGKLISVRSVAQHRKVHMNSIEADPNLQLQCQFCFAKCFTPTQYASHVIYNHTNKPYSCTICGSRFEYRSGCREHILKMHAPVRPYACEACDRQFSHLDYLHEHCQKVHSVDLKNTDKSVYLSKRMFGKIYVYPHMKIDGSLININVLEKTPVEICDYMDENNKTIHYSDAFFFDPEIDPTRPNRAAPAKKKNKKKFTKEEYRMRYNRRKQRREQNKKESSKVNVEYEPFGNIVKEEIKVENEEEISNSNENMEVDETEDVMGQLIEKDGKYYALVDGVLYELEESVGEKLKEQ